MKLEPESGGEEAALCHVAHHESCAPDGEDTPGRAQTVVLDHRNVQKRTAHKRIRIFY